MKYVYQKWKYLFSSQTLTICLLLLLLLSYARTENKWARVGSALYMGLKSAAAFSAILHFAKCPKQQGQKSWMIGTAVAVVIVLWIGMKLTYWIRADCNEEVVN